MYIIGFFDLITFNFDNVNVSAGFIEIINKKLIGSN